MRQSFFAAIVLALLFIGGGCSSSSTVTTPSTAGRVSSLYPQWYTTTGFKDDSTAYHGFGTAISRDSLDAIQRAEIQAKANLESRIAKLTEEVRTTLADQGKKDATNTDFIIILRTAHSKVEKAASSTKTVASSQKGVYRAFVQASISRSELHQVLEQGFNGHPRYWGLFSGADLYNKFFK